MSTSCMITGPAAQTQTGQSCDVGGVNQEPTAVAFVSLSISPLGTGTSFSFSFTASAMVQTFSPPNYGVATASVNGNYSLIAAQTGIAVIQLGGGGSDSPDCCSGPVSAMGTIGNASAFVSATAIGSSCAFCAPVDQATTPGMLLPVSFSTMLTEASPNFWADGGGDYVQFTGTVSFYAADGVTPASATLIDPSTPEPGTIGLALMGFSLLGLASVRHKRRHRLHGRALGTD